MKPKIKATCTKLQLQLLSFCLLCLSGKTRCDGNGPTVVTVEQNSVAVLPCSLSTKENIELYHFEWKTAAQKDGRQKEVFYYDAGITYDSGHPGQSEEFKGRVSHFQEGLTQGNASIIIRNTAVSDSGNYTCDFPDLQPRQTFHIELVVEPVVVTVKQDEDALLPCSLSTKNIEQGHFDWNKVAQNNETQKEVFRYEKGKHSPSFGAQDDGFKGRVSHFQEELKQGNASIIIREIKMADSGTYTCTFTEPLQTFHIKLVVVCVLKDRSGENIRGAAPEPSVTILKQTEDGVLLQCVVRRASPKPKVEWKDSSGNKLPAKEPQVTDRGGSYDIILQTTVTKAGNYSCVVTQEEINHQTHADIYVPLGGATSKPVIRTLDQTDNWTLLLCEVHGKPEPEVEWRDSAGKTLPAQKSVVTERDGFFITLNTTVTKTDLYRCVATQETISHQISTETFVRLSGPTVVTVEQNSDAVLPCSLSTKENIESYHFDWKKAAQKDGRQKEVFYYDAGIHYNNGRPGQSEEFKGRVSHFQAGLTQGNASITIRNTAVSDSGNYTCDFPALQPRQTFHIKLVVEPVVVRVEQDEDALLPCSRSTENIEYFDWNKVNEKQKEVFRYEKGRHSNSTKPIGSQDDGFKGRVSHFQEELKQGNASIIIREIKMADSGTYTCTFTEPLQTFHIKLVVGTCPKPNLKILRPTKGGMLLQCEVKGASPKPKVELKDSSGKILDAESQVTDRGDIILQATVTKSDNYSCVSTQEEICHQIFDDTYVPVNDSSSSGIGVAVVVTFFCTLLLGGVALAIRRHVKKTHNKGSPADQKEGSEVPLKSLSVTEAT